MLPIVAHKIWWTVEKVNKTNASIDVRCLLSKKCVFLHRISFLLFFYLSLCLFLSSLRSIYALTRMTSNSSPFDVTNPFSSSSFRDYFQCYINNYHSKKTKSEQFEKISLNELMKKKKQNLFNDDLLGKHFSVPSFATVIIHDFGTKWINHKRTLNRLLKKTTRRRRKKTHSIVSVWRISPL